MKILVKPPSHETPASKETPELPQENFLPADIQRIDPDLFAETDEDQLDIDADMPQEVSALDFLEGYRRRIPDVHEEFPPHGLSWNDFATDI